MNTLSDGDRLLMDYENTLSKHTDHIIKNSRIGWGLARLALFIHLLILMPKDVALNDMAKDYMIPQAFFLIAAEMTYGLIDKSSPYLRRRVFVSICVVLFYSLSVLFCCRSWYNSLGTTSLFLMVGGWAIISLLIASVKTIYGLSAWLISLRYKFIKMENTVRDLV